MTQHFVDRLLEAIESKRTPAVVALDPVLGRLPAALLKPSGNAGRNAGDAAVDIIWEFCWRAIRVIAPLVPVVKINSAYFEVYGPRGIEAYQGLMEEAAGHGLISIGDVKRGDVGHSAAMYAEAQLAQPEGEDADGSTSPDAVTVNGYFGLDGVKPFIDVATQQGKGVFVLVRTSNPSAAAIQDVETRDGRKMHEVVAGEVARWAESPETLGKRGCSCVGAVTATRDPADAAKLRETMPRSFLLVPGYGAQGGQAADFKPYFHADGTGALVVAGRSVILAHDRPEYQERFGNDWERCVEQACKDFVADLATVVEITSADRETPSEPTGGIAPRDV